MKSNSAETYLAAGDVDYVIAKYRRGKPAAQVAVWARWSRTSSRPAPPPFREAAIALLPAAWLARRSDDARLIAGLGALFRPLFTLYGRDYTIFVVMTRLPSIIVDSGSVIVITSGLLARADGDDELLGFVAHEVAHAHFAERGAAAKGLYNVLAGRGEANSAGAREALRELSVIELECDAVAALTLSVMGLDATQFLRSIERVNREYPAETTRAGELGANWHPPIASRMSVVKSLAGTSATRRHGPRASRLLRDVQKIIRASQP